MSLWSHAAAVAAKTPESRNRLVDFLRAASILAVISGHWLLAAPYLADGRLVMGNMLELADYTKWLSWGYQVMPVFFLVGGYANAVSWRAALRDGKPFSVWLDARLRRLILPVLPLIAAWVFLAWLGRGLGLDAAFVQQGSKTALVPIWFLAIYTLIILLVPLTHAAWQRWGFASFLVPVALAAADDVLFFAGYPGLGWFNYVFLWVAVHQLGYAWRDNRIARPLARFGFGCFGLGLLCGLTLLGPYPVAMISDPNAAMSNTLPPKLPLLALGIAQTGFLLSFETPLRRWLARPAPWTAAVLLNGMIMTIYLWHSTALALIIALSAALGNLGLGFDPGSSAWWLSRPAWLAIYTLALAALLPLVARFERLPIPKTAAATARNQIAGATLACSGLALLAYYGLGGEVALSIQGIAVSAPFLGGLMAGLLHTPRPSRKSA
ncbi:MAG TPA: acyltransferase [Gammaproteobacteria bacterium]|jgi:surface polysaccharide O-acyltransferase-like enzyme